MAASFIREKLVAAKQSFSFETVMSSPDKVKFLESAAASGFRNYLYFVATKDPIINVARVEFRVRSGGHDVPHAKIKSRYHRSLDLMADAIMRTNRAFIYDNSADELTLIAEITEAKSIKIETLAYPAWFKKYVLERLS